MDDNQFDFKLRFLAAETHIRFLTRETKGKLYA